jgi:multiple sugar transport system ATP-binding protein
MDEPLSNLDAKLRVDMRAQLARLHDRLGVTTVYVTHDQIEAMTLGQRVAVMRDGRLQQVDTPQNLYKSPANLFVAAFMGSPSMNLAEGEVRDGEVSFAGFSLPLPSNGRFGRLPSRVIVGIRPQDLGDATQSDPSLPAIDAVPEVIEELGSATHVIFAIEAPPVELEAVSAVTDEGDSALLLATDRRALFTAEVPETTRVQLGQPLRLALDPARLHLFDPETGQSLRSV